MPTTTAIPPTPAHLHWPPAPEPASARPSDRPAPRASGAVPRRDDGASSARRFIRRSSMSAIERQVEDAWQKAARELRSLKRRSVQDPSSHPSFAAALNILGAAIPELQQNEASARSILCRLYGRDRPVPSTLQDLKSAVAAIVADSGRGSRAPARTGKAASSIEGQLALVDLPEDMQLRIAIARSNRSIGNRDGAPDSAFLTAQDMAALSDADLTHVMPFLTLDPVSRRDARREARRLRRQEHHNALRESRACLSEQERDQARALVPRAIRDLDRRRPRSAADRTAVAQAKKCWENAVEALLAHCLHGPVLVREASSPPRRDTRNVRSQRLAQDFDWKKVALGTVSGDGDCLLHALNGKDLSRTEVLKVRQRIADRRMSSFFQKRRHPMQEIANSHALYATLRQVAPSIDWHRVIKDQPIPEYLMAAFQACPGLYEGTEAVAQWSRLPENRGRKIVVLDGDRVEMYWNGKKRPITAALTNADLAQHLSEGHIAIRKRLEHWSPVTAAGI